ncbi:MAG: hypothetical protein R2827_08405 [Bdellovibrionales bacterium]
MVIAAVAYGLIRLGHQREEILKKIVMPSSLVLVFISFFTFMNWVPPIPISIQHIGIYHSIEKQMANTCFSHQTPWWRFWYHSDQQFKAAPGDRLYGYARIFSPVGFDDKVYFHWQMKSTGGRVVYSRSNSSPNSRRS